MNIPNIEFDYFDKNQIKEIVLDESLMIFQTQKSSDAKIYKISNKSNKQNQNIEPSDQKAKDSQS